MRRIKVAQIGVGHDHAVEVFQTVTRLEDVYELAGYALPEQEKRDYEARIEKLAPYPELTVEAILADPSIEAVLIETEEANLTNYALMAARAGKHIHMDKPGGMCLADYELLLQTAKEKQLTFHTGYMYRYNPAVQELLARVRAGELGPVVCVEAQMNCRHKTEKRQWMERLPGGMMFYLGCHMVDLVLQFQGLPQKVIPMNRCTGLEGVTATDFGMALLEYPTGISFVKATDTEKGGFARRQLVVSCTEGTVEIKPLERRNEENQQFTLMTTCQSDRLVAAGETEQTEFYDRYEAMMTAFAQMAAGEKENPYTYDYELSLYKVLLQCCGIEI